MINFTKVYFYVLNFLIYFICISLLFALVVVLWNGNSEARKLFFSSQIKPKTNIYLEDKDRNPVKAEEPIEELKLDVCVEFYDTIKTLVELRPRLKQLVVECLSDGILTEREYNFIIGESNRLRKEEMIKEDEMRKQEIRKKLLK